MIEERKVPVEHLEGGMNTEIDPSANLKFKIEHAGCKLATTQLTAPGGMPITLFGCLRHNKTLAVKGHHKRIPE